MNSMGISSQHFLLFFLMLIDLIYLIDVQLRYGEIQILCVTIQWALTNGYTSVTYTPHISVTLESSFLLHSNQSSW